METEQNAETETPCPHRKIILRQDTSPAYSGGSIEFGKPFHYCTECGAVVKVTLIDGDQ